METPKKLKKSSDEEADDDRISHVPDDVFLHILSFVPTVDSVAICLLSRRWKHLWKHVPKLTFDDTLAHKERFAEFVNNVLIWRAPEDLQKMSLKCKNHYKYDVGNWISQSIIRNIQSLDLAIYSRAVRLPSSLFICKTLEALVLIGRQGKILVDVPKFICLPKLKTMRLVGLKYQAVQRYSLGRLISSCPSLESVVAEDIESKNGYIGFETISSTTLRDIEYRFCSRISIAPRHIRYIPTISCSALRRLNLSDRGYGGKYVRVPINVFTCTTLEQLVLKGVSVTCDSRIICLPNLTVLAIDCVAFEDDEFFSTLISSCTSLESLVVKRSVKAELSISSCTLNVIEVDLHCRTDPGHKLVLNAPALKCLKLKLNRGYVDYHIEDLAALEQADIDINFSWPMSSDSSEYCSSALTKAFQALRHVKSLKVYHNHDYSVHVDHGLPMFNRLTELDITINTWVGYCLFQKLIMNSTKLENLTFGLKGVVLHDHNERILNMLPACCLVPSLKCASIRGFIGHEAQLATIYHILGNGKIMEKMEVCFSQSPHLRSTRRGLLEKIMSIRPRSEKCVVLIK